MAEKGQVYTENTKWVFKRTVKQDFNGQNIYEKAAISNNWGKKTVFFNESAPVLVFNEST